MAAFEELLNRALEVRGRAYAPYSKFSVGAVVETADGNVFAGCNVENGVLGLSICAERVAIAQAVTEGHRQFNRIVIAASPLASPCGSCRQFLIEFGKEIEVTSVDAHSLQIRKSWTSGQLLVDHFELPGR